MHLVFSTTLAKKQVLIDFSELLTFKFAVDDFVYIIQQLYRVHFCRYIFLYPGTYYSPLFIVFHSVHASRVCNIVYI